VAASGPVSPRRSESEPPLPEKVVAIHRQLDAVKVPHAIGGALALAVLERDGQVRLWWGRNAVDLFFSNDAFHEEMRGAARRVPFAEATLPILSPEHLAVCKAMFDRPKDWLDIEQMLVATDPIDLAEIERLLDRMVGADDPRIAKLGEVKARLSLDDPAR
jgi:hypothetical protein